jgi:hypothetical protein
MVGVGGGYYAKRSTFLSSMEWHSGGILLVCFRKLNGYHLVWAEAKTDTTRAILYESKTSSHCTAMMKLRESGFFFT